MTTTTETATVEDIPVDQDNQNQNPDFSANTGVINANLGTTGMEMQSSFPMGEGIPFEAGSNGTFQTTSQGGLIMGVGGGVGDDAPDVTFSTKNNDGTTFGTTKTTTTTTTTQYGLGQTQGTGLETTTNALQYAQNGGEGLIMGVGGGVEDNAVDVTYSINTGMSAGTQGAMGKVTTTTTTTRTQYGLGQTQGQIVQGEGSGLVMGVGGGIEDNAVDVTYSSNTGQGLGAAAAKTTTTTTTTLVVELKIMPLM